ncbi:acetyl esterase [Austwickia chelonae]|uniref:Alpha/beta hydrolase fold-3 domain-containing protein n=2 Tax=Austwickia TaxID=1184606 RepID=K6V868_9MICO|nr:hypothetical protein AUCHE_09_00240 [Austwickia chelonae NBRC 105200]SEW39355.1 acetyl esterase [Austwickia chelonae]
MRDAPDDALRMWAAAASESRPLAAHLGVARLRLANKKAAKAAGPGPEMASVEDHDLGRHLTARIYRPRLARLPVLVYLHGGGFVLGDLDTHDRLARRIAHHADVTVMAVDYRRAPEFRAPAAIDDAVRAMRWADAMLGLVGGDDRAGIGIAGDSAGGLLAAMTALRLRDDAHAGKGDPAGHLLLMTPLIDLTLTSPSIRQKGHGWGIEQEDLKWYVDQWVPERPRRDDPAVNPLYASLAGLPPSFVVTAEHDPLRDDGLWLAQRLRAAGVPCEHLHYDALVHGFLQLDQASPACARAGDEALRRYGSFLRQAFDLEEN